MKPVVDRWLEFAEIDLKAAKTLLGDGSLTPVVCFHAQQGVEKSLEALIESKGLNPPKSHDLIMLYGHVDDMLTVEEDTLAKLNQTYLDTRYPASLGMLPNGPPELRDAKAFYEFALDVHDQVRSILEGRIS